MRNWKPVIPYQYRMGRLVENISRDCGHSYRWVTLDPTTDYICASGAIKYYKEQEQETYDCGQTWEDVVPAVYREGDVYETESTDCGYEERWTNIPIVEDYWCDDCDPYPGQYLTFIALEDGTFQFNRYESATTIQYSLDNGVTWTRMNSNSSTPTIHSGNTVMWKGTLTKDGSYLGVGYFTSTGKFDIEGNVLSIIYSSDFKNVEYWEVLPPNSSFVRLSGLFKNCSGATHAENLVLPTKRLDGPVYSNMFSGCTNLVSIPKLDMVEDFGEQSCNSMFAGCTSLTTVPRDLFNDSTDVRMRTWCFGSMFEDCTSLTTVPIMPKGRYTGENNCWDMFKGCTGLVTIPSDTFPSEAILCDSCFFLMFSGCTALTTVSAILPATTLAEECYVGMFRGCTSLTTVPSNMLPATTLANYCYSNMFSGCTSLTTAPDLPAPYVPNDTYSQIFEGCTSLNYVKCLATSSGSYAFNNWLKDASPTGTFVKASGSTWATGASGIPDGWTVVEV